MLKGRVCLVTGASRAVGKGIAQALGAAGATVYVTGRSTRDNAAELAQHYGVKDLNGFEPPSGRGFMGDPPSYSPTVVE
ncbi:MAG: hypothetical protein Q7S58_04365 [Candidatus Binatus sp.]|uniref:hypothetical protein n=1 Tax=Candidatus Binatus sp. TaxID=2811406 RepID=UPI002720E2D5|nr:hypothetical protein [Candidatus Binatus sp.]MDO8431626.1 hypothetical protein [Candidatus Binatus sp.]